VPPRLQQDQQCLLARQLENIIREEMNSIGGQELLLTTLQGPEVWAKSGRWQDDAIDNWFKTKLKNGNELGIANTHEEALANLMTQHVHSYKDLPVYAYQIQNKFRNELRPKSGILRAREFLMKDLYSFNHDEKSFRAFYEICADAYMKIFNRIGIGELTHRTFASGGSFSKFSDEFQTLSDTGEDTIYIDTKKHIAVNKEVYTDEVLKDLGLSKDDMVEEKSIEVGNIFPLGVKYAEALGLLYTDEDGNDKPVVMGSYGIGLGRLMGTVVEVFGDKKGIVWPKSIAPFALHLVLLDGDTGAVRKYGDMLYTTLHEEGIEVLYDDRDTQAGEKFATSDLIGVPYRAVVSARTLKADNIELVERKTGDTTMVSEKELIAVLQ